MAFRVQEFRANMARDGARPNLFDCEMSFPIGLGGSAAQSKFTFSARAAQLPGDTVNQVPQFYFGRELKFSGNRTFPEWTVTIINDEDFIIRDTFTKWMSKLNSHVGNQRDPAFVQGDGGYQADGFVTQYGKDYSVLQRIKFVGMFPIDISPIELDWGSNDTIEEYAVTFAYQWWEGAGGQNGPITDTVGSLSTTSPLLPPIA